MSVNTTEPYWPDEAVEATMLSDAKILHGHEGPPGDAALHIQALLHRVRELERALRCTGYFQSPHDRTDPPFRKDYFDDWKEAVEYAESVDTMLDGIVPTQADGKTLWLRERVAWLVTKATEMADLAHQLFQQFDARSFDLKVWQEAKKQFGVKP